MADVEQRIRIVTEFMTLGQKKAGEAVAKLVPQNKRIVESTHRLKNGMMKVREEQVKLNGKWTTTNKTTKKGLPLVKQFKSEYLSLLFAGMAVERMFGSLVYSQLDVWGISDLLSSTIMTVMIPAMSQLLDILMPVFNFFMNLSDTQKEIIGWTAIIGTAVGTVTAILATAALTWSGLTRIFPALDNISLQSGISAAQGLLKGALTAYFLVAGIKDATSGKWVQATSELLTAGGLMVMTSNPRLGAGLLGIGAVVGLTQMIDSSGKINVGQLVQVMIQGGIAGAYIGGPTGIAVGVALVPTWLVGTKIGGAIAKNFPGANTAITQGILGTQLGRDLAGAIFNLSPEDISRDARGAGLPGFASGGIVPGGLGQEVPIIAHGGEQVVPYGQRGDSSIPINVSAVYNVTVSDKREFEAMLRDTTQKMTDDIRRLAQR